MNFSSALQRRGGMAVHAFLVRLMASPLGARGAELIRRVPGLWTKVFLQPALPSQALADAASLKREASSSADPARVLFSLALHYLEAPGGQGDAQALACLRSAAWLGFAAHERLVLYRAIIGARRGDAPGAQALAHSLQPCDLTAQERQLLDAALSLDLPPQPPLAPEPSWDSLPAQLLVLGDPQARSAGWLPHQAGLFVDPELNGLSLAWCVGLDCAFDTVIGSAQTRERAQRAGLRFRSWQVVDFPAAGS